MMMREWAGIDRLRLNKFYTLLKCVLKNSLRQLHLAGWPAGGAEAFAEVLRLGPFSRCATRGYEP
jgi:ribosomal RNA-processing protein 1